MEQNITMKYVFIVNGSGFIVGATTVDISERELRPDEISTPFPPFIKLEKPRWNGNEWVEGETQEEKGERESHQLLESLNPSEKELSKAERELETIDLLLEMGLI